MFRNYGLYAYGSRRGAQACHIQQVTSLFDSKYRTIIRETITKMGRDALYEESMKVTHQIMTMIK